MNCEVLALPSFERQLKYLAKKYKSLRSDFSAFLVSLKANPYQGVDMGGGIRKVRLAIKSKGKGKSAGARVITLIVEVSSLDMQLFLLDIYDKSDRSSISKSEINEILKKTGLL